MARPVKPRTILEELRAGWPSKCRGCRHHERSEKLSPNAPSRRLDHQMSAVANLVNTHRYKVAKNADLRIVLFALTKRYCRHACRIQGRPGHEFPILIP